MLLKCRFFFRNGDISWSIGPIATIRCALCFPVFLEHFRYLHHCHMTYQKFSNAVWNYIFSKKMTKSKNFMSERIVCIGSEIVKKRTFFTLPCIRVFNQECSFDEEVVLDMYVRNCTEMSFLHFSSILRALLNTLRARFAGELSKIHENCEKSASILAVIWEFTVQLQGGKTSKLSRKSSISW